MGFNGTFMAAEETGNVFARLPALVRRFHEQQGATFVAADRLSDEQAYADRHLFGVAIAPPIKGWIAIVNTEGKPSRDLAAMIAKRLGTPAVISSIAEICDPPQPEAVEVFGAEPDPRFELLYYIIGFHYAHLAEQRDKISAPRPFGPDDIAFATYRATAPRRPPRRPLEPDDIAF